MLKVKKKSEDTMSKKEEVGVMDYTDKVYNYMKSFMEENGFNQTVKGIAKELERRRSILKQINFMRLLAGQKAPDHSAI